MDNHVGIKGGLGYSVLMPTIAVARHGSRRVGTMEAEPATSLLNLAKPRGLGKIDYPITGRISSKVLALELPQVQRPAHLPKIVDKHSRDDSERSQVKKLYRLPSTPQFFDHGPEAHPSCHRRQIATLYRRVCNCDTASASLKSEVNQWADNRCVSGRR